MIKFDIFHILAENSVNSLSEPKSEIHQKMPIFERFKTQVVLKSEHFLTPH